jgi:hypothetical protein
VSQHIGCLGSSGYVCSCFLPHCGHS